MIHQGDYGVSIDPEPPTKPSGVHFHADEQGMLRRCYHSCPSWAKIIVISGLMNIFWEYATFWPVHESFTHLGLIS